VGDDGIVVGHKTWWIAKSHLGAGPFRWVIYRQKGGGEIAASAPFYLPDVSGRRVTVEVALSGP